MVSKSKSQTSSPRVSSTTPSQADNKHWPTYFFTVPENFFAFGNQVRVLSFLPSQIRSPALVLGLCPDMDPAPVRKIDIR
mmetsp:Transcript_19632/g.43520  ORF Transcript_19632/g.43520 Transcript_19632/m.43520 type:complete len:80 (-) Transcript_19632:298-537(-)